MTADSPLPGASSDAVAAAVQSRPATDSAFRAFGVLPAAGRSSRMGAPKLLLPWHTGGCLVDQVLQHWLASNVERLVVVVHPDDRELATRVAAAGAAVVVPDRPPPDMRSSVIQGLAWIAQHLAPSSTDVWLVAPADMPLLPTAAIDRLIAAHLPAQPQILVTTHRSRRGHPVLFPWPLAADVPQLPLDQGLKRLLELHSVREIECPEPGVLIDIDTPQQYHQALVAEHS